jgi:hypothetical protein
MPGGKTKEEEREKKMKKKETKRTVMVSRQWASKDTSKEKQGQQHHPFSKI